jgi:hypothetical protein
MLLTYLYIYYKINIKYFIMKLTKEQLLGIVRHTITFIGGLLVMKGLVDDSIVQEILGGVTTLVGAIWSIVDKKKINFYYF